MITVEARVHLLAQSRALANCRRQDQDRQIDATILAHLLRADLIPKSFVPREAFSAVLMIL